MKKELLLELALKMGIKEENFTLGYKEDPKKIEKSVVEAAGFMGLIKKKKK